MPGNRGFTRLPGRRGREVRPTFSGKLPCRRRARRGMSAVGLLPDAAVVHELDLALDDLLAVLGVLHRRALEIEVLGIDRLLVEQLVELGTEVLHPVVPLGAGPVVAQRLDVDHAAHVRRAGAVVLAADDAALVVDDERAPAEGVDGRRLLGEEVVGPHVGRHQVHVVVEGAGPALDLEDLVAGGRVRIGRAIDDLGAVEGQRPRVLRVGALVGHHDAEPTDLGVGDRPECVEISTVFFDPPIVDVMRTDRVLDGEQRRNFIMLQDHLAARVDDEAHVEEAVLEVGVPGLGLGHDERVVLLGDLAERLRLLAGDVDRALAGEGGVVEVEHLVVERLQRALGERDQPHGNVERRQPRGRFHQVAQVLEVDLDVLALADAAHGGDETDGGVGLDHAAEVAQTPGRVQRGPVAGFVTTMTLRPRASSGILAPCDACGSWRSPGPRCSTSAGPTRSSPWPTGSTRRACRGTPSRWWRRRRDPSRPPAGWRWWRSAARPRRRGPSTRWWSPAAKAPARTPPIRGWG